MAPRKNPRNPALVESLQHLKDALKNLNAHRAEMMGNGDESGDDLGWAADQVKRHVSDMAYKSAMNEGLLVANLKLDMAEKGAKLSTATKAQLQSVVDSLQSLFEPADEPTDETKADAESVELAVRVALESFINDATVAEAVLKAKQRNALDDSDFADPENRAYPIQDKAHADNALARIEQNKDDPKYASIKRRILAAQKKFGEGTNTTDAARTKHPGLTEHDVREITILPKGVDALRESAMLLGESEGSQGNQFDMLVIRSGTSKNRVNYRSEVLQRSLHLLEGRPIYVDHPTPNSPERSLARKVGWWDNVRMAEVDGTPSIIARANIMENSGQAWFLPMVREAIDRGHPEMIGISILAGGDTVMKRDEAGPVKEVLEIKVYASADAVSEPGAGGRPLSLAASDGEDSDVEILKNAKSFAEIVKALPDLKISEIRDARPDLFNEDGTPKIGEVEPAKPITTPIAEGAAKATDEKLTTLTESLLVLQRQNSKMALDSSLRESNLPKAVADRIRNKVGDTIMSQTEIDDTIKEFADILNDARSEQPASAQASWVVPYGSVRTGMSMAEQLSLAADDWFGAPIADDKKGKFSKIRSMREYYMAVTGDRDFRGEYNPEYSVVAEALPGATHVVGGTTITMSNLLGTSMNRALVSFYQDQPKWWKPVVNQVDLDNMKQQDRIRLVSFGALTQRTTDGAEYVELDWGDNDEHYTPTEYGNIVTVGRRAIINDDLKGIQRLPQLLAQSATLTLNEYISNLFTQSSGTGPLMGDGYRVFDASHHQGNRVTTALNRANVIALMKIIMKMQNDASKTIGVIPRYLLSPIDLWDTGYELIQTQYVPDSANNAKNVVSDEAAGGLRMNITVPNWTDTNDWYLMADPKQLESIELGFLFGREEPELLSQQDPTSGLVWTNDVISYKVRHDYGASWIDYRGAAAANVA